LLTGVGGGRTLYDRYIERTPKRIDQRRG